MNRFTLRMDQDDFSRSVENTFEALTLPELMMEIDMFIRGCGYVINTYDTLEYVSTEVDPAPKGCGGCGHCK